MSSTTKHTSAFSKFFAEHHNIMLKRDIPLTGDDATLDTKKKDGSTLFSAIRDFFKTHQRDMTKRGIIATLPGDSTFAENGASKHKEDGVLVTETSEKIQGA